jgi:hypothetical protein
MASVFHAKNILADIWPELFEDVGASRNDGLGDEIFGRVADIFIAGDEYAEHDQSMMETGYRQIDSDP